MGSGPDRPPPGLAATARANGLAALTLLAALRRRGLGHLVLCPGSRSAPLAVAAALLEGRGLRLHTAIDERSAAFFALGLGRALGQPAAVVTTSGTAVAQLLAAAVEADLGTIPLLLLSADRPQRLKDCGANQAVPQERFLLASCRRLLEGPPAGLAAATAAELEALAAAAMTAACGDGERAPAGPVHCNLPFEEPLHVDGADVAALEGELEALVPHPAGSPPSLEVSTAGPSGSEPAAIPRLDPGKPGVVVAGPWRGAPQEWQSHVEALRRWQRRSGWPVLADVLSGLRGLEGVEIIGAYDPLLQDPGAMPAPGQVLRLGTLPASRRLQRWLESGGGRQVLISQGDPRRLDPLGTVATRDQWSGGLARWVEAVLGPAGPGSPAPAPPTPAPSDAAGPSDDAQAQALLWQQLEAAAQAALERKLPVPAAAAASGPDGAALNSEPENHATAVISGSDASGYAAMNEDGSEPALSEPWLARALSRLLPAGLPVMLASSSPVRDWESFAAADAPWRPVHGFRGASGIDGTLSIACGLAEALDQLVLVSGDLALLHDANGWLWARQLRGRLTVVLIDNGGGGIFEQLPIRTQPPERMDFERLFAMPQNVDQLALAAVHGVPGRRLQRAADLPGDLAWALQQPFALLELRTRRQDDAALRQRLRQAVSEAAAAGRMAGPEPERR